MEEAVYCQIVKKVDDAATCTVDMDTALQSTKKTRVQNRLKCVGYILAIVLTCAIMSSGIAIATEYIYTSANNSLMK